MEKGVGRNFVSFQNHLFLRFSTTQRSLQLSAEFRSSTECKVSRPLSFTSCFEAASNNAMFWFFVVASARHHGIYGTWRLFHVGGSLLCSSLRKQPPHIGRPQERERVSRRVWSRPMWGGCFRRLSLFESRKHFCRRSKGADRPSTSISGWPKPQNAQLGIQDGGRSVLVIKRNNF